MDDPARERADVGAAVAAKLGLVVHAAEGGAHERAAGGVRDRLAERGLADAGGAGEAEDGRPRLAGELEDGHGLEDPALDVVEAAVVLVELLRDGIEIVAERGSGIRLRDPLRRGSGIRLRASRAPRRPQGTA